MGVKGGRDESTKVLARQFSEDHLTLAFDRAEVRGDTGGFKSG